MSGTNSSSVTPMGSELNVRFLVSNHGYISTLVIFLIHWENQPIVNQNLSPGVFPTKNFWSE